MKLISKKDYRGWFFLVAVTIFAVFSYGIINGENGVRQVLALQSKKEKLRSENIEIMKGNLQLLRQIHSMKDPQALEKVAKETLGFVYPDETIFVLPKQGETHE